MSWNLLNLADSAAMYGGSLTYAWLSDGTKVEAKATDGSGNGVRKRYVGSFVYSPADEDGEDPPVFIEGIAWDEGRIFFAPLDVAVEEVYAEEGEIGGRSLRGRKRLRSREVPDSLAGVDSVFIDRVFHDCWFAGDHLGNVRSVIDITADLPAPEVLEQSDYLPYGTRIQNPDHLSGLDNRWRYAAKEEQRFGSTDAFTPPIPTAFGGAGSLDLSLLDFGARMYDPYTARWVSVDQLASLRPIFSSFSYCSGNTLNRFDPDGNADWGMIRKGTKAMFYGVSATIGGAVLTGLTGGAGSAVGAFLVVDGLSGIGIGASLTIAGALTPDEKVNESITKEIPTTLSEAGSQSLDMILGNENHEIETVTSVLTTAASGSTITLNPESIVDCMSLLSTAQQTWGSSQQLSNLFKAIQQDVSHTQVTSISPASLISENDHHIYNEEWKNYLWTPEQVSQY